MNIDNYIKMIKRRYRMRLSSIGNKGKRYRDGYTRHNRLYPRELFQRSSIITNMEILRNSEGCNINEHSNIERMDNSKVYEYIYDNKGYHMGNYTTIHDNSEMNNPRKLPARPSGYNKPSAKKAPSKRSVKRPVKKPPIKKPPMKKPDIKHHAIKSDKIYLLNKKEIDHELRTTSRLVEIIDNDGNKLKYKDFVNNMRGRYPMMVCSIDPGNTSMGLRIETFISHNRTNVKLFDIVTINKDADVYEHEVISTISKLGVLNCDIILLEKQVGMNKDMIRLEHILRTAIMYHHITHKSLIKRYIITVSSKLKTKLMVNNHDDKKTVTYHVARDILHKMNDKYSISIFNKYLEDNTKNKKPRSDLADTVCQLYSFLYAIGYVKLFR